MNVNVGIAGNNSTVTISNSNINDIHSSRWMWLYPLTVAYIGCIHWCGFNKGAKEVIVGGVWGYVPPGKFLHVHALRSLLVAS